MATEPFIGEVRMFAFNYAPKGWATCDGQLLPISQYTALFSILGTTFGGNGTTNFALPNLQGRVAVHPNSNGSVTLGQIAGSPTVTLLSNQIGHSHSVQANATANSVTAAGNFPATEPAGSSLYAPAANTSMHAAIISPSGGNLPHNNLQPYLVVIYCIALVGIFPTRN